MTTRTTSRGLAVFARCVLASLLLVVLWGAVVRATGSGDGCGNHWPLCNGQFWPSHPGLATIIEFVHRQSTGLSTTLTVLLGVWIFLAKEPGHPARGAWLWTMFFLVVEAALGAVLVKRGDVVDNASTERVVMQVIHFTNTMLLMASITLTAWLLGRRRVVMVRGGKHLSTVALVATLIVGAVGSLAALADTLYPSPTLAAGLAADFAEASPFIVRMRWMHPAAALVGLVCAVLLALRVTGSRTARVLLTLVAVQVLLGLGDILLLTPVWLQVLHLLGADLFWMALVVLTAEVWSSAPSPV